MSMFIVMFGGVVENSGLRTKIRVRARRALRLRDRSPDDNPRPSQNCQLPLSLGLRVEGSGLRVQGLYNVGLGVWASV